MLFVFCNLDVGPSSAQPSHEAHLWFGTFRTVWLSIGHKTPEMRCHLCRLILNQSMPLDCTWVKTETLDRSNSHHYLLNNFNFVFLQKKKKKKKKKDGSHTTSMEHHGPRSMPQCGSHSRKTQNPYMQLTTIPYLMKNNKTKKFSYLTLA